MHAATVTFAAGIFVSKMLASMSRTPDALTDLLVSVGFEAAEVGVGRLTAPWAVRFPGDRACALHCLLEGECSLWFEGQRSVRRLLPGSVVVLLVDRPHIIADRPGRVARR